MTGIGLWHILAVAGGGALGGVARYWLATLIDRRWGAAFPVGILAVNVTGSFGIGVLAGLWPAGAGNALWAFAVIGCLGSYTTVSSFALQTHALLMRGERGRALANVLASVLLCILAVALGFAVAGAMR